MKRISLGTCWGLVLCPLTNPEAVPALSNMCSPFPRTRVVIDHMARIGMSGPVRDQQVEHFCFLAKLPEVRVKLSAFYALGFRCPHHLDLADLVRRVFEAYGPERLLWGSDCPFQLVEETYEDSISLVRDRSGRGTPATAPQSPERNVLRSNLRRA